MSETLKINGFYELNVDEMYTTSGGGWVEALAVGLVTAGTIALTIACPPAGVAVTVAICAGEGILGTVGIVQALK
jgi:hypothetical protein